MAKHHFDVPRTIARVNNPRNEELFRHLGVDEIISPTRMALAAIEQDIPVHELLHLAQLEGGELELIEAQIGEDSPAIGRRPTDIDLPDGCSLFVLIRDDIGAADPHRRRCSRQATRCWPSAASSARRDLHRQLIGARRVRRLNAAPASGRETGRGPGLRAGARFGHGPATQPSAQDRRLPPT